MSLRALFGGASKCRTVDICDIFGDNSGKALYRLDGNANDESGNYHGTETAITYGGGVYERGAVFNGTTAFINTNYTLPTNSQATISFWHKNTSLASSQTIYADNTTVSTVTARCQLRLFSSAFVVHISNGISEYEVTGIAASSAALLTDGSYHLITMVYNGTSVKLYFDNSLVANLTSTVAFGTAGSGAINFGRYGNYSTQYVFGSIDQVRIFNRAITATEVATLYAECAPTSTVDNINPFEDGSLKALYQFNGDATDKTGVYNGTATNVAYGTGKFGQCAVFNGSSSKVDTGIPSSSFLTFSLTGWAKAGADTTGMIVNKGYTGLTYRYNNVSTQVALEYYTTSWQASALATIPVGTWFHYSIVYTAGTLKAYIDGNLKASISTTIADFSANIFYGMYRSGTSYFNGSIDQARFFNKALTPMEVASLYNETTPLEEPMHSLVDPFKDGSGKALYRLDGNALDESGNYNGTATSVTYGAGRFGRAGVFNGSSSRINSSYVVGATSTISFWVYKTKTTGHNAIQGEGSNDYIALSLSGVDGDFQVYNGTACFIQTAKTVYTPVNTWIHFVIVDNGSSIKVYKDNVEQTNNAGSYVSLNGMLMNAIGYYVPSTASSFGGNLDQLRIFNRALTASEVSQLYTEI